MIIVQLVITRAGVHEPKRAQDGTGWGRCPMVSVPRVGEFLYLCEGDSNPSFKVVAVSYNLSENKDYDDRNLMWTCDPEQDLFAITAYIEPTDREGWDDFLKQNGYQGSRD